MSLAPAYVDVLRKLLAHGKPVKDFNNTFELSKDNTLCSRNVMTRLNDEGFVSKVAGRRFWLTDKGKAYLETLPNS